MSRHQTNNLQLRLPRAVVAALMLCLFAPLSHADRVFLVLDGEISTSEGIKVATTDDNDTRDTFPYYNEPDYNEPASDERIAATQPVINDSTRHEFRESELTFRESELTLLVTSGSD